MCESFEWCAASHATGSKKHRGEIFTADSGKSNAILEARYSHEAGLELIFDMGEWRIEPEDVATEFLDLRRITSQLELAARGFLITQAKRMEVTL